jgi:hypothetical protein
MWKKVVALFLVVVTILSFTACDGEGGDGAGLPSAQEIIDGVLEAAGDLTSQSFESSMSIEAVGEEEGELVEMALVMDFDGAMDLDSEEMRAEISMSLDVTDEDAMEMAMAIYVVDGMGYMMMDMPEMEPMWMKEEVGATDWEEMTAALTPSDSHLELLEVADVTVTGSERVKGIDCYVLDLTPGL